MAAEAMPSTSFRTKTGTCEITDDAIVLTREGARGALAEAVIGQSVKRALIRYGVIALLLTALAVHAMMNGQLPFGVFQLAFALYIVVGILRSRGVSAQPEVPRAAIQRIRAHRPIPLLTRGYFDVSFNDGDQLRRRLIILPGYFAGGSDEFEKAVAVLGDVGLLSSGGD